MLSVILLTIAMAIVSLYSQVSEFSDLTKFNKNQTTVRRA